MVSKRPAAPGPKRPSRQSGNGSQGTPILVIGASAGGIGALVRLLHEMPPHLPAAVFVVVHVAPNAVSTLPAILQRAGTFEAKHAQHGDAIVGGRILVAPPNRQLVLERDCVRVTAGPREHGYRPSVDLLFRSAAVHHEGRTIGVLLSGLLDDGTLGMAEIARCGGTTFVQDPNDAEYPSMPQHALAVVDINYVATAEALAPLIVKHVEAIHAGRHLAEDPRRRSDLPADETDAPERRSNA